MGVVHQFDLGLKIRIHVERQITGLGLLDRVGVGTLRVARLRGVAGAVRVGVVGIGAVGAEMVRVLRERDFPAEEIRILARSERDEKVAGETFHVVAATAEAFDGLDFAFFAGTEGAKGASQTYGWEAVARGVTVIDNGDDFRMDERVPLVLAGDESSEVDALTVTPQVESK